MHHDAPRIEAKKAQAEEQSLEKEREALQKREHQEKLREKEEELAKARKQTNDAEWAQTDALDKLKRYKKLHSDSESMLKRSAVNNDRAAQDETKARESFKQDSDGQRVHRHESVCAVKSDVRGSPFQTPRTSPRDPLRDPLKPPPFGLGGAVNAPQFALPLQQSTARQYFLSPTAKAWVLGPCFTVLQAVS
eukprot:Skav219873  [mRNA]  locus=scaffold777:182437:188337:+ [translate_table: standard]